MNSDSRALQEAPGAAVDLSSGEERGDLSPPPSELASSGGENPGIDDKIGRSLPVSLLAP